MKKYEEFGQAFNGGDDIEDMFVNVFLFDRHRDSDSDDYDGYPDDENCDPEEDNEEFVDLLYRLMCVLEDKNSELEKKCDILRIALVSVLGLQAAAAVMFFIRSKNFGGFRKKLFAGKV